MSLRTSAQNLVNRKDLEPSLQDELIQLISQVYAANHARNSASHETKQFRFVHELFHPVAKSGVRE